MGFCSFQGIVTNVAISFVNRCHAVDKSQAIKKPLQFTLESSEAAYRCLVDKV